MANSSIFSRPNGMKPFAFSRATAVESYGETTGSRIFDAHEQVSPFATMQSLMPTGMPSYGLRGEPDARRRSDSSAASMTASLSSFRNALMTLSSFSTLAM